MGYLESTAEKIAAARLTFAPLIGLKLSRYETARLRTEGEGWSRWDDLPIRLFFESGSCASVSWTGLNELWVTSEPTVPAWLEDSSDVGWVDGGVADVDTFVAERLLAVGLGRGEFVLDGRDIEIWTRLLLTFESGHLEIYNALDENGYESYEDPPVGELRRCV
ncbi:MAG: hypothetical protein MI919_15450 [Holophagales bacterium]|nr:hypothetical protein [Holophagales bacterium]